MKTTYSYSDKVQYFTNKAQTAVSASSKLGTFTRELETLAKFYDLTDKSVS